ncbi:MAG TPA: inorganic diphosphatase [Chthoniobacteraceae bacterium]|nr:inorganic diphosphatase [Chthoniobacteraceae bacterium]
MTAIDQIKPFADDDGAIHIIIDTPRGSRNKFKWDKKLGVLKLSHILTAGAVFPFDFGFVPGTRGADGDALDVLVLTDEPLVSLCLVRARLIGVIEAEQTEDGKTFRNDRMLAVTASSRLYAKVRELDDLPPTLVEQLEQFFISYNKMRGRVFKPIKRGDSAEAMKMIKRALRKTRKKKG